MTDLEKYGFTENCPGCTAKKRGRPFGGLQNED